MFLLISTLVILAAAAVILFFQKRQPPQLLEKRRHLPDASDLRPLFAPDEAQIERARKEEAAAKSRMEVQIERQASARSLAEAEAAWLASPGRKTTVALIRLATDAKNADTFAKFAQEILQAHRDGRVQGLTDNDVAALLDSHIVLLPVEERGSGALFLIRQQIAELRSAAEPEVG